MSLMAAFPTRIELHPESFSTLTANPRTRCRRRGIQPGLVQLLGPGKILIAFDPEFGREGRCRNDEGNLFVSNNAPDPRSFQYVLQQGQLGAFLNWQTEYSLHSAFLQFGRRR